MDRQADLAETTCKELGLSCVVPDRLPTSAAPASEPQNVSHLKQASEVQLCSCDCAECLVGNCPLELKRLGISPLEGSACKCAFSAVSAQLTRCGLAECMTQVWLAFLMVVSWSAACVLELAVKAVGVRRLAAVVGWSVGRCSLSSQRPCDAQSALSRSVMPSSPSLAQR